MMAFRDLRMRIHQPALRRDTAWTLASFGTYSALGAAQAVAISRHLGPEAKGYVSVIVLGPAVVGWMLAMGLAPANAFLSGTAPQKVQQLLTMSFAAALVLGWGAAATGWLVFGGLVEGSSGVRLALALALVTVPALLLRDYFGSTLIGLQTVALYNQASIAGRVVGVGMVIVATYAASPPVFYLTVGLSQLVSSLPVVVAAAWHLRWRWAWSASTLGEQLRYGLRSHIGGVSEIGALRFDQYVIFSALGVVQLGLYSAAVLVSETLNLLAQAITSVTFGRIASAPRAHAHHLALLSLSTILATLVVIAIPLLLLSDVILSVAFGPAFAVGAPSLRILVVAAVSAGVGRTATSALRALGHPLASSIVNVLGLAASIPLVLWLVPSLGIEGAALASLGAYTVTTVAAVALVYAATGRRASDTPPGGLA